MVMLTLEIQAVGIAFNLINIHVADLSKRFCRSLMMEMLWFLVLAFRSICCCIRAGAFLRT